MRVRSVNVSGVKQVMHQGELIRTGIFKEPVAGPVAISRAQVAGDRQADLRHHGGADKAVYAYPWEHYVYWAAELARSDFVPGQFGENLTLEGLLESAVCIGDRLRVGSVLLEVSQPRIPCFKLGIRMKMSKFPKIFLQSGRIGFYFRVLEEGTVQAGDSIALEPSGQPRISVADVSHVRFFDSRNTEMIERILRNPALATVWREDFDDLLAKRH